MPITLSGDGTISGLTATGISAVQNVGRANLPAGSVLQVVQGKTTTGVTSTTSTFVDTGLTASITPTSATSKILVIVTQGCTIIFDGSGEPYGSLKIVRNSTDIFVPSNESMAYIRASASASSLRMGNYQSFTYLDSPATTASTTYKTQQKLGSGTSFLTQVASSPSTIILMEIAA
jgi:hypothetical protein